MDIQLRTRSVKNILENNYFAAKRRFFFDGKLSFVFKPCQEYAVNASQYNLINTVGKHVPVTLSTFKLIVFRKSLLFCQSSHPMSEITVHLALTKVQHIMPDTTMSWTVVLSPKTVNEINESASVFNDHVKVSGQ